MTTLPRTPPLLRAAKRFGGLVERHNPSDDVSDRGGVDQRGDLRDLVAASAQEEELVNHAQPAGLAADAAAEGCHREPQHQARVDLLRERGVGWSGDTDGFAAARQDAE